VRDNLEVDWKSPVVIKKAGNTTVEEYGTNLTQVLSPEKIEDNYKINIFYKVLKTTTGSKSSYSIV
jgi:hypothetical protein